MAPHSSSGVTQASRSPEILKVIFKSLYLLPRRACAPTSDRMRYNAFILEAAVMFFTYFQTNLGFQDLDYSR